MSKRKKIKFNLNSDSLLIPLEEIRIWRFRDILFRVLDDQILDVFQPLQGLGLVRFGAGAPVAIMVPTRTSDLFAIRFQVMASLAFLKCFDH